MRITKDEVRRILYCLIVFLHITTGVLHAQILDGASISLGSKHLERFGKFEFGEITYRDSLMNYFTSLDTIAEEKHQYTVRSISGKDTLECYFSKPIYADKTMEDGKKYNILVVESKTSPYRKYRVITDSLDQAEINMLVDSVYHMPSPTPYLVSAPQTCLSYAFECMFRLHGIDPEPICYRRSLYPKMNEINWFLNRFCLEENTYIAKKKSLEDVVLPEKSVLIFRDEKGNIIHGAFYMDNLYYSKNGQSSYTVDKNIIPLIEAYSRYGKGTKHMDKEQRKLMAHTVTAYVLNEKQFKLN